MTDLDRAELRRRRDEARSETCRKRYTAAEAKSLALELADGVDALLDALDEAEREADDVSTRLSEFLCEVTGSMLSYSTYPVSTMIQHTEEYFDRIAKENHDDYCEKSEQLEEERDAAIERAEAAEAAIERVRAKHVRQDDDDEPYCGTCFKAPYGYAPWPCPTMAALAPVTEEGDGE